MPAPISPASRRIEAPDARADERRRVVWLTAERVQIARSVGGVFMRIDVEPSAYRGVALCLTHFDDEGFHYEVRLVHADPDLNIPLESCVDAALATARWKRWARFFAAPKLVEREPGVFEDWGLTTSGLNDRQRRPGRARARRRPRFALRRSVGEWGQLNVVTGERELFGGWRENA